MSYEKQLYAIKKIAEKLGEIKNSSHAVILVSKDNVLLDAFANLMIMQDVCGFAKKPCFECANCQKVTNGNAIDVEVFGEQKNILVADSAKIVADSIVVPFEFEKKYFILKNFDKATEQAQNKLLKVIEEPRSFDKFVLLTSNIDSVLPTIKSRVEIHRLPMLSKEEIFSVIKYENFSREAIKKSLDYCDGNLTKCLKILKDEDFFEMQQLAEKLVMFMQSSANMLEYSSEILKFRGKIADFLQILTEIFVNLIEIKYNANQSADARQSQLSIIASKYSETAIVKILEQINLAVSKLKSNLSQSEIVDNLLLKILEIKYLCK